MSYKKAAGIIGPDSCCRISVYWWKCVKSKSNPSTMIALAFIKKKKEKRKNTSLVNNTAFEGLLPIPHISRRWLWSMGPTPGNHLYPSCTKKITKQHTAALWVLQHNPPCMLRLQMPTSTLKMLQSRGYFWWGTPRQRCVCIIILTHTDDTWALPLLHACHPSTTA